MGTMSWRVPPSQHGVLTHSERSGDRLHFSSRHPDDSEPVDQVAQLVVARMALQEPPQRADELAPGRLGAAKAARRSEHDAEVGLATFNACPMRESEVRYVFRNDRAPLRRGGAEQLGVDELAEARTLRDCDDVMAVLTKTLGHGTVVLLVEQQSQRRAACCWRRQAASSRSASSVFRRIQSSISVLWSA